MSIQSNRQEINLGTKLCQRAEQIYKQTATLRQIYQAGSKQPVRLGCSVVSMVAGVKLIADGNFFLGGTSAVLGAKEIWNICSPVQSDHLLKLLNNIHADAGMIETLEEANLGSLKDLNINLSQVRQGMNLLSEHLDKIKLLQDHSKTSVGSKKQKALEENQIANQFFLSAGQHFEKAMSLLESSNGEYGQSGKCFLKIQAIARSERTDVALSEKIEQLINASEEAFRRCKLGKDLLTQMMQEFDQGMKDFGLANMHKEKSLEISAKAFQETEDILKFNTENQLLTRTCLEKVSSAENAVKKMQVRSEGILRLIQEMRSDLEAAQKEAARKLNLGDVVVGSMLAATLGSAIGVPCAAAVGISAAYTWHHGDLVTSTGQSVYRYLFGISQQSSNTMRKDEKFKVEFDEKSSGYFGKYVMGRSSKTTGRVQIRMGADEVLNFRFNLNDRDKISRQELLKIYELLTERVDCGILHPNECLEILQNLKTVVLDRGEGLARVNGLVAEKDASFCIFNLLKDNCLSRI